MKLKTLTVVLKRNKQGRIVAHARQMTPEGEKEGTNLLKGKFPKSFPEARTLVEAQLNLVVDRIEFLEESPDWERE